MSDVFRKLIQRRLKRFDRNQVVEKEEVYDDIQVAKAGWNGV